VRFALPRNASALVSKERAEFVSVAAMAKFANEGFTFLGHSPLSLAPQQRKLLRRVKEAAFSASAAVSSAGALRLSAAARPSAAAAPSPSPSVVLVPNSGVAVLARDGSSVAGVTGGRSTTPGGFDRTASRKSGQQFDASAALDGIASPSASGPPKTVEIVRSDRNGNVYYKK